MNFVYDPTSDETYETQILKDRIFKMRKWMYEEFSPKKNIAELPPEQPPESYSLSNEKESFADLFKK